MFGLLELFFLVVSASPVIKLTGMRLVAFSLSFCVDAARPVVNTRSVLWWVGFGWSRGGRNVDMTRTSIVRVISS